MAIELITGLPGNSKTLHALRTLIDRAVSENRAVYYAGLKEFKADDPRLKGTQWFEFDPLTWHETVPSGALIFIDEAQKVFRSRSLGAVPPKHVTELEEHRHKGIDFVMVTQHPSLIDPAVRKLTQTHKHLVRIWGMEATTVHRWDAVRDNCDKPSGRKDSESHKWVFDKTLYGLYKSADFHTMKRRLPGRVKLLLVLPFVLAALVFVVWHKVKAISGHDQVKPVSSSVPGVAGVAGVGGGAVGVDAGGGRAEPLPLAVTDPVADAKAYVLMRTPRVKGLPETAPRYDALTVPTRVPVPAMCIQIGDGSGGKDIRCKCWSQQATPLDVPFNMCIEFANNGVFRDFDPDKEAEAAERQRVSQQVLANRPDAPLPDHSSGGGVVVIPGQSMGPQRTDTSPPMTVAGVIQDGPPNNRAMRAAAGSVVAGGGI